MLYCFGRKIADRGFVIGLYLGASVVNFLRRGMIMLGAVAARGDYNEDEVVVALRIYDKSAKKPEDRDRINACLAKNGLRTRFP